MRAYTIFDDYPSEAVERLKRAGMVLTVHPLGMPRPDDAQMEEILKDYECVIIGTSQKISEKMLASVDAPKLIVTASVGTDHIHIPDGKAGLITVVNTPGCNTLSAAEYVVGAMLLARKRVLEGAILYSEGRDNKKLVKKPEDLHGAVVGLVGAGRISTRIVELLQPFGVRIMCFTKNPEAHRELTDRFGAEFVTLDELAEQSDLIAVNIPYTESTHNLVDKKLVDAMKDTCVFVSISREQVLDIHALEQKAKKCPNFYLILDLDLNPEYSGMYNGRNIFITPHIAGGTIESRKRMFMEAAERVIEYAKSHAVDK